YEEAIGCPTSGDCYVPGSEHLLSIELLFFYAALIIWPVAAYNLWRQVRSILWTRVIRGGDG
ncbi:MAG TPA: hypothetical protein VI359_05630, partial [Nitrospiraceae bacterium]